MVISVNAKNAQKPLYAPTVLQNLITTKNMIDADPRKIQSE